MGLHNVRLPSSLQIESRGVSTAIIERLHKALGEEVLPTPIPLAGPTTTYSVRLPVTLEGELMARFASSARNLPVLVSQLIWANETASRQLPETMPAQGEAGLFANRPEQARFHAALEQALEQPGALVLAEGGTGLGKGRVIAALAHAHAARGVVVAAPTIQILGQLLGEYAALPVEPKAKAGFLLGVDQFVSEQALVAWLDMADEQEEQEQEQEEEEATRAAARAWVADGAPQRSSATAVFHRAWSGLGWLAEDLATVAPGLPLAEVRLKHADLELEDRGANAYRTIRMRALAGLKVLFVTHAALVWDRRAKSGGRVGMLPEHPVVLIDEAHQLSGVAESSFTSQVALRTVLHALDQPESWRKSGEITKARKLATALRSLINDIGTVGILKGARGETVTIGPKLREALEPHLKRLQRTLGELGQLRGDAATRAIADEGARLVRDILDERANATITLSRVRGYPSIVGGPRSIRRFFEEFWASIDRAALISATLYLPREMADMSYGLIQTTTHLPPSRIRALPPVVPAWLYQVDLHMPAPQVSGEFAPPQESDYADAQLYDAALSEWIARVAGTIADVHQGARGGVLVLLTSYETIDALAERLAPLVGDALVAQRRGGFRVALKDYVARYRDGVRPLWLATGPAWTGLDLSAKAALEDAGITPEQDFLCTDLLIPRVPFGTEQSSSHRARAETLRSAERDRAAFQFRQGLGRLMRVQGVLDRHLWVLDGRIHDRQRRWLFAPVNAMLKPYALRTRYIG
jgi:Rad3-related DNA helicase